MLTDKPWRLDAVILFLGLQVFSFCLGGMIIGLLDKCGLAAFKPPDGFGMVVVATLSFQGATWGLMGIFLWQHQTDWREFFGLRDPHLARALGWAVFTVAVLLPVLYGLQTACAWILTWLGHPPGEEEAVQLVENAKSIWVKLYMSVFAVVLAPVAEEFIFRGLLFRFIKQLGFPGFAWFGVSGLFALIHCDLGTFVPLFVLALALTWLYQKTGNLLASITAHSLFNAVNLIYIFAEPQLELLLHKILHTPAK